jgi:hypothetical protein
VNSDLDQVQKEARSKIESSWKNIAENYTVAWMGPLKVVEMQLPHVSSGISDIRSQVSSTLPLIIYQTRQSPPDNMSVAVPYRSDGDPYKCRLVATNDLSPQQRSLLGEFAQAIWFLIDTRVLPHPSEGSAFGNQLVEWTDAKLMRL